MSKGIVVILVLALALLGSVTTLAADELLIKVLENKVFKMEGDNVHIIGLLEITKGDLFLTAGEIVYNSEQKTAKLSGAPYLRTNDAEVNGEEIAADFEAEHFVFSGSVKIVQSDRLSQADKVVVDNQNETYLLTGNVIIIEAEDQKELLAAEVFITTDPDIIEVRGPVEVSFVLDDADNKPRESTSEAPATEVSAGEIYVQVESLPAGKP